MRRWWLICTFGWVGCFTADPVRALPRDCQTEICDGVDNDCDGEIDEGLASREVCDAIDNDCDGVIDEEGVCPPGCSPATEVCNGRDDDCDGRIDEGLDAPEVCDGIDNNCNGQVDEGFSLGLACDGVDDDTCSTGVLSCLSPTTTQCLESGLDNVCVACNGDRDPAFIDLSNTPSVSNGGVGVRADNTGFAATWDEADDRIVFAVLDSRGNATTSFDLSPADGVHAKSPALAFNGTNYGVVWMDAVTGPADTARDIYFQLVDGSSHQALLATPLNVSADAAKSWFPRIAWAQDQWFVVWECGSGGEPNNVCLRRIEANGTLSDAAHVLYTAPANTFSRELDIAYAATLDRVGVVWREKTVAPGTPASEIFGCVVQRTDNSCTGLDLSVGAQTGAQWPHLDSNGSDFGIVWFDNRNTHNDIYFMKSDGAGAPIGTTNIRITDDASSQQFPGIAWDGAAYVMVWEDLRHASDYEIYTRSIYSNESLGPEARLTRATGSNWRPQVTAKNGSVLASWTDNRSSFTSFEAVVTAFRCVP